MTVNRLFDALAARDADAVVLVGDDGPWSTTALLAAVDELAASLHGTRALGVLADNGPAWVAADLAALRAGVAHVPLPTFFSPPQLRHVFDETRVDTVLTDQPERVREVDAGFMPAGRWRNLVCLRRDTTPPALPAGTAKVSFTSGSTGRAKGVCLGAEGMIDTAQAVADRLDDLPIRRHLAVLPLSLLLENVAGIYAPLLRGAEIHLPSLHAVGWKGMAGFDAAALQRAVLANRPASLILVPELLKAWTLHLSEAEQKAPTSLAYVAVGGAHSDAALLRRAKAVGLPAYQGYGLTECGSVVSLNRPGDSGTGVGRALDHVAVHVRDGEIVVSARAFLGYLGRDAAAAGAGPRAAVATGDLGAVDDAGHLHLSGRRGNLLITSFGRNISPEWIEAKLLAQAPIAQAVATGDGRPWLSAVLVPARGAGPEAVAAAVASANAALPDYARVGDWVTAPPFTLQNGQATGNGRPVRAAILARYAAPLEALYSTRCHRVLP